MNNIFVTNPKKLRRQNSIRIFAFLSILLFLVIVLLRVDNLLTSFVLSFVISYLLAPLVNSFERSGFNRSASIFITFTFISIILAVAAMLVLPLLSAQIISLKSEFPKYIDGTLSLIKKFEHGIENFIGQPIELNLGSEARSLLVGKTSLFFEKLPSIFAKLFTISLLAPLFSFFSLKDGRFLTQNLLAIVPNHLFETTLNLFHQLNDKMGQFVRARLLEAAIVGFVVWVGLSLFSIKYAIFLALFALFMNLIPYIGPIIGVIPAVILCMVNSVPFSVHIIVLSIYLIAQLIDIIFIIPLVVAKVVNLHPISVIVSIIIGAQLLGILGMIIAIPIASAFKVILTTLYDQSINT